MQHAGVDEGGIVKVHGDHLVILRRGRLFTVEIGDERSSRSPTVDAFGAGHRPARRLVRRDADLRRHRRRDRLQLRSAAAPRSGCSTSTRARPAQLQCDLPPALERLLLVAQLRQPPDRQQAGLLHAALPQPVGGRAVRAVPGDAQVARRRDAGGLPAHRPGDAHLPQRRAARSAAGPRAAHASPCATWRAAELACEATAVLGPAGRVFYVSPSSVYVWTTRDARESDAALGASACRSTAPRRAR